MFSHTRKVGITEQSIKFKLTYFQLEIVLGYGCSYIRKTHFEDLDTSKFVKGFYFQSTGEA